MTPAALVVASAGLDPSPDEARSWLRRELLRPEYQERDLAGRLLRWLDRQLGLALEAAGQAPALTVVAAMVVGLVLALGAAWLLSRVRGSSRARRADGPVLAQERRSAADLRRRARAALDDGRHGEAVVEAYRALAVRQVEQGWLDDVPGATAHEVAAALALHFPARAHQIEEAAVLFDAVLYGDRPATRAQAESLLSLDQELSRGPGVMTG